MSKKKNKNKIDETMMYYAQKKCEVCGKLIVGRSPGSYRAANSDLGNKLKAHREKCQEK
ncbi:MAG: hypothetical protein GH144_01225 [Clostridia bacterium]|jgi:hypothetical protein|nr:hypothetical protein [Clostridia bacterium]